MMLTFCLSIRGVYEHVSWAQLHTWNVHPECAWTAYGTSFTSPRSCPSDVNLPRASREAPRATLSSAYLISLCCQSAHKTLPLNPPRPSGRTEPRVAQSCRHSGGCGWKACTESLYLWDIEGHIVLWPMGLYSCVNNYRGVLFINFKFAFIFYHCCMVGLADLSVTKCVKQMKNNNKKGLEFMESFNISQPPSVILSF